ncbi:iron ABC transporter permease [Paenibacillus sp. IB182496]|uniref:Iron ABC transporter permease n=1 Tax=Paenibacillus sabuli TaxID=2772509 RepID=A0A927BZL4_9BACL|nr:iron ABC transporter permease [Paenibacillus sabuli]MBD2848289.1 iron ABC transporter permease [Paenibacillus sabuli]
MSGRSSLVLGTLALALALCGLLSMGLGAVYIRADDILAALLGSGDPDYRVILLDYRLPRVLIGILVGAALAVAGVVVQTLLRNGLASPGTLGITAGAGMGAVLVVLALPAALAPWISPAAFVGAAAVALAIYGIAYKRGVDPVRLTLVGVALGAFCGAGIDLLLVKGDANLATALVWLAGSLWGRSWAQWGALLPWIALLLPLVWYLSLRLDVLGLGQPIAKGLGMAVARLQFLLLCSVIGLAGSSVAAAGTIGFVGLICPHMAASLVGRRHHVQLPVAALLGAIFVVGADFLGRMIKPPLELPAGLIISAIGAPYFIYLMWRASKR